MAIVSRVLGLLASLALIVAALWLAIQSWQHYRVLRADAAVLQSARLALDSETTRQARLRVELAALKAPACPPGQVLSPPLAAAPPARP